MLAQERQDGADIQLCLSDVVLWLTATLLLLESIVHVLQSDIRLISLLVIATEVVHR